jgi:hypothetical protein
MGGINQKCLEHTISKNNQDDLSNKHEISTVP